MKLYRRLARTLWLVSATLAILLAVVVSLARLLLPYLDEYRNTLQARVSAYLGQPVAIEQLDARLLGLAPSLILRQVTLQSATSGVAIAHFDEIHVGLDLYATLREGAPVLSQLVVAGAELTLVRRSDGRLAVEGVALAPRSAESSPASLTFGDWLLSQGHLAVRDSALLWRDELRNQAIHFEHVDLELVNNGARHRLNGSVVLPEGSGTSLRVAVDLRGNPLAGLEWGGSIYAKAEALRPVYWFPLLDPALTELALKSGELSAEIWSEWQQGVAVRSEGTFLLREARLQTPHIPTVALKEFSGALLWQQRVDGWTLDLQGVQLQVGKGEKKASRLHLRHGTAGDLLLADRLTLEDVARVAMHLPLLQQEQSRLLQVLAPRGEVRRLRLERHADGRLSSQGEFSGLGMDAWEYAPGFDGATGRWRADTQGGEVYLDSRAVRLDAPRLFRAPLQIDAFAAVLSLRPMEQGWHLAGRNINARNADISTHGEFDIHLTSREKPYLDLRFDFHDGVAKEVPRYVPARIMGDTVVEWLDRAFAGGMVRNGTLLFHGRTADFPFAEQQGVFETRFQADAVDLAFERDWPHLEKVSGEVLFENQGMAITPHSGKLFSTEIEKAAVTIADLRAPLLEVTIAALPPAGDILRLMRETPLAHHVGNALTGMTAAGQSELLLQLRIPLSKTVAVKAPLHYEGTIRLHDAALQVWEGVTFRQLNGAVSFSDSDFRSTALQGELFEAPAALEIRSDDARTLVTGHGRLKAEAVRRTMKLPLLESLQGESDWRGLLFLPRGEGSHPSLEFHSTLAGIAVQLPAPIGKGEGEAVPLAVRMAFGEEAAKRVSLSYGERVFGRFVFGGEAGRLQRAALQFGPGTLELPKEGWRISGSLENLDWSRWHSLLPSSAGAGERLPLSIDMARLSLVPMTERGGSGASLLPENFPQLDLHIRDFRYDDWRLGELTGSSRSDRHYWEMPDLRFVGPHHDIHLSARWREGQRSQLEFTTRSDNIEAMLHDFGLATMISTGNGSIQGKLEWEGMLTALSWGVIDGTIEVELKEGALVEVEPGAGRLFGLLSLQALPRRLALDFRDLFQKGMQFDEIKGTVRVSNGDAKTDNLYIKSPSAGILVEGRTGLVRRDYDHILTVVPNVSESVSIASAIAWGPQVAAAVLLFQNIFKKDIAKVTMIRYSVKGSWDDPQITRLSQP